MYIILNRAGLVVAATSAVSYIKVTDSGLPIITSKEEATAIYAADNDTIYTLRSASVWGGGGWEIREVETVPDEVAPGFWYWSEVDGFYTTPERAAARIEEEAKKAAPIAASIAFVTLAEAGWIDDVTAAENAPQFAEWAPGVDYEAGMIRRSPMDGNLYRVNEGQSHRAQEGWDPSLTPALWSKIGDPSEEWPQWAQPISAADSYQKGAKVSDEGKHWINEVDNNVWKPGVYGWKEETENE